VEEGEDVAAVLIKVARELGTTYVLLGSPHKRRGLARLAGAGRESLLMRLLDGLPGVDVRIVADPTLRRGAEPADGQIPAAGAGAGDDEHHASGAPGAAEFAPRAD
jgi:K+-sensing histidine kinase KdpD